jgi:hypothetical protein
MLLLGAEGLLRRPLPSGAKEIADALAGLLFVFAFSRCSLHIECLLSAF